MSIDPARPAQAPRVDGPGPPARLVAGSPRLRLTLAALIALVAGAARADEDLPAPAAGRIDFDAQVRPIFDRSCRSCHGPKTQRSGFRLDAKADALKGGDLGPAILPGRSAESPLVRYVAGLEPDMLMPPKGERLTAAEIATLRAWIDQGAPWPEAATEGADPARAVWWSLRPLARPAVPRLDPSDAAVARSPIDAFILAKLREKGLAPSPEADRRTLIRRVTFDLIGLPPTPAEVAEFVADTDPLAYERLVDRLLASPQYGERWGRHWLDVARYGDTHGYDKDQPRPNAWPYRDYVIRAFNEDRPYDRFVREQLAGDVLYPGTRDGIEALGFIAAGPWDFIGHAEVPETKVDGQIARLLDRDDMVSNALNAFNSLTVQCARCHNHKFDPVTQEDYYSLQAVFAALDRSERPYDIDPAVARRRAELTARREALAREADALRDAGRRRAGGGLAALDRRIAQAELPAPALAAKAAAFGYHSGLSQTPDAPRWVQVDLGRPAPLGRIVLHACDDDFNGIGEGFGFPARFKVEASDDPAFRSGVAVLLDRTAEDVPNPRLAPVAIDAGGLAARFVRVTATRLAPRLNDYNFALAELEVLDASGADLASGAAVSALDAIEAPPRWRRANLVDGYYPGVGREDLAHRKAEREALIREALGPVDRDRLDALEPALADVRKELDALPRPRLVYAGTIHHGSGAFRGTGPDGGRPRVIRVLRRGDVRDPRQVVGPGTVAILDGVPARFDLPADAPEGERRAALARWITEPRHPLTWRSIVNRVWQYHFGRAIVDSPNDFGRMGQLPSHPELLDWLAAEFRDGDRTLKRLHRRIVTSATYRQASGSDEARARVDSGNVFLWRMNRRRLEAESIRDAVLAVAGRLDPAMGGPGYRDFVVEHPEHSPHYQYHLFDPEDRRSHRRSVYRFIVRSQPQPFLATLDCADPSMSVEKRNESLTPLQALALRNNRLMVVMSAHFADRLGRESADLPSQVDRAIDLALARTPTPDERGRMVEYARRFGLPNLCRLIYNLNEFVFVD